MNPIGLLLLGLAFASGQDGTSPAPASGRKVPLPGGTPPWPQTVPEGLPPFPGTGWEFDEPPPPAVQARAKQLVTPLWKQGSGATKTEQTAGRWITYRAEVVASGHQGIVAYRLKPPKPPPRLPSSTAPSEPEARNTKPKAPARAVRRPKVVKSAGQPQPTATTPAETPKPELLPSVEVGPATIDPVQLPELKIGDGLKPKPKDPNVAFAQLKLKERGIPVEVDGRFGRDTQTAVIAFQVQHGLAPNEPVEHLRARGFGAVKLATWKALLETRA